MDHVSPQIYLFKDSSYTAESVQSSKSVGRLRTACDACHNAKTKCSGGTPCSNCRASRDQCVYSVGTQLGRPRGSKNRRTLQPKGNAPKSRKKPRAKREKPESDSRSDSLAASIDSEHTLNTALDANHAGDGVLNDLFYPSLASIDTTCSTHVNTTGAEDILNSLFTHVSNYTPVIFSPYFRNTLLIEGCH